MTRLARHVERSLAVQVGFLGVRGQLLQKQLDHRLVTTLARTVQWCIAQQPSALSSLNDVPPRLEETLNFV